MQRIGESARWADLTIRLLVKANSMSAIIPHEHTTDYTEHCVQSPDRHRQHLSLKRQTAYHRGVRSHAPLSINEMCTHCRQPIRILLARQPANHKLITICWNLEWGTYDVSHLQILTCEVAVSTGGSVPTDKCQ